MLGYVSASTGWYWEKFGSGSSWVPFVRLLDSTGRYLGMISLGLHMCFFGSYCMKEIWERYVLVNVYAYIGRY